MTIGGVGSTFGRITVGHPIDVASGEFFTTDIDHELPGTAPLSFGRTFNTRFLKKPLLETIGGPEPQWLPFGPGWRPTWFAELRATTSGFRYTRSDGVEFSIRDAKGEKSFARTGRMFSPADGIEVQRVDDMHVRVIGYGRDRHEFSLVFERLSDVKYRLVAIERTREAKVLVIYDPYGRPLHLVQRREQRGYELVYEGDRVVRVVLHLADRTKRVVAEYGYDSGGRLVSVQDARGMAATYGYDAAHRIVHDEKRGGSVYTVGYSREGRCDYAAGTNRYQERSLHYDVPGRKTRVKDSHGNVTLYEWNERGQVVKTTSPAGVVTRAEFDDLGRSIRETGPNGELREYEYDAFGRMSIDRRYGGIETTFHYDDDHRLVAYGEAGEGEVVTRGRFTYDADHNLTSAQLNDQPPWRYDWTPAAELTRMTAPSGASASREYDALGGLQRATNWEGHTWTWIRDALGRVVTETNPLGHTWSVEYLDPDGTSLRVVEPDGRVYAREVSADERTIVQRLPGNRTRSVELSFCANPIRIVDEEGAITSLDWGTEPSELLTITNASGVDYTFKYDADMRVVERCTFDGRLLRTEWSGTRIAATYDGMGRRTEYEYDLRGLVTKQMSADGETKLEYDKRGLLESVTTPSATSRFWRDDLGRLTAEEQDGIRVERPLDVMGRPIGHKTPYGAETTFAWSPGGHLKSLRYGDVEVGFERDALGRETKRHLDDAGVFEQAYDSVGRLIGQTFRPKHSGGASASAASPGVVRQFGFDERGFLASIEDSIRGTTRLLHNDRGDLTGVVRQNGLSDFYSYDRCQNRVYHAATQHGAALAAAFEHAEHTRATDGRVPIDRIAARFPHDESTFGYERGDRIVVISRPDSEIRLTYDANGQVTSKTVHRGKECAEWRYGWNARGELVSLRTPNGKVWTYRYDALGRRIEKRSPTGDTWRYVWTGELLVQTLKNEQPAESYVHEPRGTCPILRDDGDIHFILPDQNASPSEELGTNGRVEWTARKGTWGEAFSFVGAAGGEPFLGQSYDAESGLHYNYFRYYDPDTGRYLSPDPIDLAGGLNAFLAVSDPFTQFDRFGLSGEECGAGERKKAKPAQPTEDDASAAEAAPSAVTTVEGGSNQTFRIIDGVRRAKAAQLSGIGEIPAEFVDAAGRTASRGPVAVDSLLSPKPVIDTVSTPGSLPRWLNTLRQTASGSTPPPIRVMPGTAGTPIEFVRIGKP